MDCFTFDTVKQIQPKCGCGADARAGQRNCHRCHALANQLYRLRQAAEKRRNHDAILRAMAQGVDVFEKAGTNQARS